MCSRSAKNEILKFYINSGEDIWITVHGPSMFPILQENNKIHIRKILESKKFALLRSQ